MILILRPKKKLIDSFANEGDIIPSNHEQDFELDNVALGNLLEMGFEFGPACIILKKCNNDCDVALGILLGQIPE